MRHVHFIGIGGVGMNGLAQLAAHGGYQVSGSDRAYDPSSSLFRNLEKLDIRIFPQDGSAIDGKTNLVVYSTAIESNNPDIAAAEKYGVPLLHRSEFLNRLIDNEAELIAVAGTAGKTTTTGMVGWIFDSLGQNPSVYNGAAVLNWRREGSQGNVRAGSSKLWIIEADESDRSFLNFHPSHSIITNISKDHYELDELYAMFRQFADQTSGMVVEGSTEHLQPNNRNSFLYKSIEFRAPVIGLHNLENALCAVRLCDALGFDLLKVRDALACFKGIERRLEVVGDIDGITIIDDYAHNPAKIAAALSAVSQSYPKVHAFWRPHGFAPLFQNMDDLVNTFANHMKTTDGTVFILPVYYAGGTVERKATAEDLVNRLVSAGASPTYVPDFDTLKIELEKVADSGDAILGMGARDPELPRFAKQLVNEWKSS